MTSFVKTIIIAIMLALASSSFLRAKGIHGRQLTGTEKRSSKIAGGIDAPLGSVPHQVVLTTDKEYFCSGSIIDRDFVITAGQCCVGITPTGILGGVNDLRNPEEGAQQVKVGQVVAHPNYTDGKHINDICILQLKEPLTLGNSTRTAIIPLPSADYVAEGIANVSGWGLIPGGVTSKLVSAQVPIVSDNECQHYVSNGSIVVESIICAGAKGKGACLGDTGGPLVDSMGYLVGVVSRGNACMGYIDVYTEVAHFVGWVNETMSQVRKGGMNAYSRPAKVGSGVEYA